LNRTPAENRAAIIDDALRYPSDGATDIEQAPGLAS
jgi:hypothetical protein